MRRLSRFTMSDELERQAISERKLWDGPVVSQSPAVGARTGKGPPNLTHARNDGNPEALHLKKIAACFVQVALSHSLLLRLLQVKHNEKTV